MLRGPKCVAKMHRQAHDPSLAAADNGRVPPEGGEAPPVPIHLRIGRMRENDKLEEIFDRYAGLELLDRDRARAPAGEFSQQFREEPLPQGVAGGT